MRFVMAFILAAVVSCPLCSTAIAAPIPINLNTWSKKGPVGNGNWIVAPDGSSVLQTINGNPTFFVSPDNFIDTTLRGTIRVGNDGDDDYIGFVFGFNGPMSTGNDMDFVLLDWKRQNQNSGGFLAQEGFAISRVNGTITNYLPGFWGHTDSAQFDVLATNFDTSLGWVNNTTYNFEILYQTNRMVVTLSGGAFGEGTTIFDIAGTFPEGRFGFYNYSQAQVQYAGLTEEDTPAAVPEPASLALFGFGALGLTLVHRRRKAA